MDIVIVNQMFIKDKSRCISREGLSCAQTDWGLIILWCNNGWFFRFVLNSHETKQTYRVHVGLVRTVVENRAKCERFTSLCNGKERLRALLRSLCKMEK